MKLPTFDTHRVKGETTGGVLVKADIWFFPLDFGISLFGNS